jgi:hypothetical protein
MAERPPVADRAIYFDHVSGKWGRLRGPETSSSEAPLVAGTVEDLLDVEVVREANRLQSYVNEEPRAGRNGGPADEAVLDRQDNRHIGFGDGIRRGIGSNPVRVETEVGLRGCLRRFRRFEIVGDLADIGCSNGAVRGPDHVRLRALERSTA